MGCGARPDLVVVELSKGFTVGEPLVVKKSASAFLGTDVAERLYVAGVDTVVITGCSN